MTRDEILNMPAGREMDALVSKIIFESVPCGNWAIQRYYPEEWIRIDDSCNHKNCHPLNFVPLYSSNISAAWEVVEKMHSKGAEIEVIAHYDGSYFCVMAHAIPDGAGSVDWGANAIESNAPLAICRAALLAIIEL
jgi:hypothetical protein